MRQDARPSTWRNEAADSRVRSPWPRLGGVSCRRRAWPGAPLGRGRGRGRPTWRGGLLHAGAGEAGPAGAWGWEASSCCCSCCCGLSARPPAWSRLHLQRTPGRLLRPAPSLPFPASFSPLPASPSERGAGAGVRARPAPQPSSRHAAPRRPRISPQAAASSGRSAPPRSGPASRGRPCRPEAPGGLSQGQRRGEALLPGRPEGETLAQPPPKAASRSAAARLWRPSLLLPPGWLAGRCC